MKYKVGDVIICNTEKPANGPKRILMREPSPESTLGSGAYQIVAKSETFGTYKIIIDEDMTGWQISSFHVEHEGVPAAFKGRRFYDVHENFVIGEKK